MKLKFRYKYRNYQNRRQRILQLCTVAFAVFFIFSLSLHNHRFALTFSSQPRVFHTHFYFSLSVHPKNFCSACLSGGNLKPYQGMELTGLNPLGVFCKFFGSDLFITSLALLTKGSPRSPPLA